MAYDDDQTPDQDPSSRYKVRPRKVNPDDQGELPTAKVPAKVAVPVPVPVPAPQPQGVPMQQQPVDPMGLQRYKISPPQMDMSTGRPVPSQPVDMSGSSMYRQPGPAPVAPPPATTPMGDTTTMQTAPEEIPPGILGMRTAAEREQKAEAALEAAKNTPAKKEKWYKSLAHGALMAAAGVPPAHDWSELAYDLGRVGAGAGVGAAKHDLYGEAQKRYKIAQAEKEVGEAQKGVETASKVANIESEVQARKDLGKIRVARLNRDLDKDQYQKLMNERKSVSADLRRLPYLDPSNPTHAKILERAKAAGMDVDSASFGKGKKLQTMKVSSDDGHYDVWYENDPQKGWVPVKIQGKDAIANIHEIRNPVTGQPFSSEERDKLAKDKFDFQKVEAKIHDSQAEKRIALQAQGLGDREASARAEAEAIDDVLPDLEEELNRQQGPDGDSQIAEQIRGRIATLRERRGKAAGTGGVPSGPFQGAQGSAGAYTEQSVRDRAVAQGKDPEAAVQAAKKAKLIP